MKNEPNTTRSIKEQGSKIMNPKCLTRITFIWSRLSLIALFALSVTALTACDDDDQGVSCANDDGCERGQICASGKCSATDCSEQVPCPGTGRACLSDLKTCSVKECGDIINGVRRECAAGAVCLEQGAYRYSCVSTEAGSCVSPDDCLGNPNGENCCEGECKTSCEPALGGTMGGVMAGMSGGMNAGVSGGVMMPSPAHLCSPCRSSAECAALGEGAACTAIAEGSYCTQACDAANPCPGGYNCVEMLGQCIPSGFRCAACLQEPCAEGFCDITSEECVPPQGRCATCTEDAACANGRLCRAVGGQSRCVDSCDGGCPTGTSCQEGACIPEEGVSCDACAGACTEERPFCIAAEERCGQCGETAPCEAGYNCDIATNTCVEAVSGSCISDADCEAGVCVTGACRECLQDSDCPSRHRCDPGAFTCVYEPCAGVECQRGSTCEAATGRCNPGCSSAADCVLPDTMECNTETGQCYYKDGSCDFGGDGVCAPGGQCVPNAWSALNPTLPPNCSCAKEDPSDPLSADRIACQPGTTCTDLGAILSSFGIDTSMLDFEATCGVSPF